ncbi:MAG: ABC transporter ATP-binding protein [Bacilli bacterium]|jgi:ABC-type lipoprotein export system ATPase subunit|nr:ABC transporter ATP-binding protein [Bacilli bacterium]
MIKINVKFIKNGDFKIGPIKLDIEAGILYHLTGKNGSGKSTLLNHIFRYYRDNISKKVIYCPDDYIGYRNIKINEIEKIYKLSSVDWDYDEYNFLYLKLLQVNKNKYISTLSTGERTKLLLCILLAFKPKLIIFDEALYSLDTESKELVLSYIKLYVKKNNAYFIGVSHDSELSQFIDKTIKITEVVVND